MEEYWLQGELLWPLPDPNGHLTPTHEKYMNALRASISSAINRTNTRTPQPKKDPTYITNNGLRKENTRGSRR